MAISSDDSPLYPPIDPYESGMLAVGDGHEIYWEVSGNPDGQPVVFLHGGPGGATIPDQRRFFDPATYRIVLFDQRGCGRSTPHAATPGADMSANTTWHLVADIEALRAHLDVESWHVFGGSWGSALALAYAQQHAERVRSLVLRGIFTLREAELAWFYEGGASALFPDWFERYVAPVPTQERGDCMGAFHRLLHDPDPKVHGPAAVAWSTWEAATTSLLVDDDSITKFSQPEFALAFARIENHYFVNKGWFSEGQLIEGATALANIPGVIVQGRYDACTPATTAWDLHRAWPQAEFVMVPDAGHASTEPGIARALVAATDKMAHLPLR
ncbi:prolyl aminopeptidase [Occultella gossypii]|uniref:Proline iminopeptidase n=1 Tax=Occultella gossypii TaxID=2800820 RepID=A0ABS7SAF2_9MICO|nr:prolyl aminopeptidase [Occultella gossypii]MBZ2196223.1 prolyl aminopeptidase [Occultella gossypii]